MSDQQALHVFLHSPVSQDMIHHLVGVTLKVLPCESATTITQEIPASNPHDPPTYRTRQLPSLMTFISKLVRYTNVYTGTLMSTIIYMNRLKSRLPPDAQGMACTRHRIFLACLIIASKYFNDSSPKNVHWSKYTDGLFDTTDVNLMERQLLMLLDWDLRIDNVELVKTWKRFLDPIKSRLRKAEEYRKSLLLAQKQQPQQQPQYVPCYSPVEQYISHSRNSSVSSLFSATTDCHSRASSVSSVSSNNDYTINKKHSPDFLNAQYGYVSCLDASRLRGYVPNYVHAPRYDQYAANCMMPSYSIPTSNQYPAYY